MLTRYMKIGLHSDDSNPQPRGALLFARLIVDCEYYYYYFWKCFCFSFQVKSLLRRLSLVVSVLWFKTPNQKRRKNLQKIWISFDENLPSEAKTPKTKRRNKTSTRRKRQTMLSRLKRRQITSSRRARQNCLRNQVSHFFLWSALDLKIL